MSAIHTWACLLLWISFTTQDKTPDVTVTCVVSEECVLPCSFQPGSQETVQWFRQDTVVYKFTRDGDTEDDSHEEHQEHQQLAGRASVFPHLVSLGNATLVLKRCDLKDRGTYRCHVHTSNGQHNAKVILMVQAPIRGLSLELSRLSGYEEMKCTVHNVFPAPRVTWATEPPTFEDLRPITRMQTDKQGLFTADSRLRLLSGQTNLIYICKVTTPYGGPVWTASHREREIRGTPGKDLTIPCSAPSYLNNPSLEWCFSDGEDPALILNYDSHSGSIRSAPPWDKRVELDGFRVPFGDGSLRLMNPTHSEHRGSYTCRFSVPFSSHTERTDVIIDDPVGDRSISEEPTHWWVLGLVIAGLILALGGLLVYLKLRGRTGQKPRHDPEEATELHLAKDSMVDTHPSESSVFNITDTNGQSGLQTDAQST